VVEQVEISTAKEAADHELIVAFGRLQGAANRLEYILGRAIERECAISHLMFVCPAAGLRLLADGWAGDRQVRLRVDQQSAAELWWCPILRPGHRPGVITSGCCHLGVCRT
jgi:hypothetical protein